MENLHKELTELHEELRVLLEEYRIERAKEEPTHVDSYWQGKKDGLRTAMLLIYPLIKDDD